MLTYSKCAALYAKSRDKAKGYKLANNTYVRYEASANCYLVRLHSTDIITVYPDDSLRLFAGGYRTPTTKQRLNEYSTARVWSERGVWYAQSKEYPFAEGLRILADGTIDVSTIAAPDALAEQKTLRNKAKAYAKAYTAALYAGKIDAPSNGDCWCCLMTTDKGETPLGGPEHIKNHMAEKYYVPSLVYRALERSGASQAARHDVAVMTQKPDGIKPYGVDFVRGQVQRAILKHCMRELGL